MTNNLWGDNMFTFGVIMLIGTIIEFLVSLVKKNTLDLGNILMIIFLFMALPYLG
jgi:hypothetical protein